MRLLMNFLFMSQFSYCPLVWMFHSHRINSKINSLHKRCPALKKLLELDGSVPMHIQNFQVLATEMFKTHINEALPIFSSLFESHNTK